MSECTQTSRTLARSTQFNEAGDFVRPSITTKDGTEIFYPLIAQCSRQSAPGKVQTLKWGVETFATLAYALCNEFGTIGCRLHFTSAPHVCGRFVKSKL